jgi:xanthine dehydrogenase accessory factor
LATLHAPIGLDIGADQPAEIALSILSEVVAVRAGRLSTIFGDRPKGRVYFGASRVI